MMAGAVLGYLTIIPTIYFIGQNSSAPIPPATMTIQQWEADPKVDVVSMIQKSYLLYIGAGCVAAAGLISMARTLPMIVRSVQSGIATVRSGSVGGNARGRRSEDDLPFGVVLFGSFGLIGLLALFLTTEVGPFSAILGALLVVLFGFLFVTVSARLTGEIGSSSNPISGMTTATLMVTCLIFLTLGMTSPTDRVLALSVAAVVCVAASNGGTTAQALKTGFLVGGTPRAMQYAILVGALVSALVIGGTLLAFNAAGTVYSNDPAYLPRHGDNVVTLTPAELGRLQEKETYDGKQYLVWDTRREFFSLQAGDRKELVLEAQGGAAPEGRFLVDPETGTVAWLKDPTIGGKIKSHDGRETTRFPAPKTKVMHIIIDGVLSGQLNWTLVLIGAMIAVTLELCGVSSLAFAVGVYVPIQFSVPIFLGGIVRWAVDTYLLQSSAAAVEAAGDDPEARARAEIEALRKTETSPGVLLASGYIAGGSLAGVVAAFLQFSPSLVKALDFSSAVEPLGDLGNNVVSLVLFAGLVFFAFFVGLGWVFKSGNDEPNLASSPSS
jgi:uncharacterized oligopeptide transporter (OPT) family protein